MTDRESKLAQEAEALNITISPATQEVLSLSEKEAKNRGVSYIGTEHILLALLRANSQDVKPVLEAMGTAPSKVRNMIVFIVGEVTSRSRTQKTSEVTLTPRSKRVIELADVEMNILGDEVLQPVHLLLGLIREGEGIAYGALDNYGANLEAARTFAALYRQTQKPFDSPTP